MNNNINRSTMAATTLQSQTHAYRLEAKRLLENTFPRLSCAVIDLILRNHNHNFTLAFRQLSVINNEHSINSTQLVPKSVKIFIKSNRPNKQFEISDEALITEIDNIPELNRKVTTLRSGTSQALHKSYKYSCSLVRLQQGRVHMLCTYSDENDETVHWMLLPLLR